VRRRQLRRGEQLDAALEEQVIERADADRRDRRRVRQDDVELVQRELGEQPVGFVLAAHQAHGRLELERRLEQASRDQLGHHVGHADDEP
jgi:hypothetical protein